MDRRLVRLRQQPLPPGVQALAWILTAGTVIIYANTGLPKLQRVKATRDAMRAANIQSRRYMVLIWPAIFLGPMARSSGKHGRAGVDHILSDVKTGSRRAARVHGRHIVAGLAGTGLLAAISIVLAIALSGGTPDNQPVPIPHQRRTVTGSAVPHSVNAPPDDWTSASPMSRSSQLNANDLSKISGVITPARLAGTPRASQSPQSTPTTAQSVPATASPTPTASPEPSATATYEPLPCSPTRSCLLGLGVNRLRLCLAG